MVSSLILLGTRDEWTLLFISNENASKSSFRRLSHMAAGVISWQWRLITSFLTVWIRRWQMEFFLFSASLSSFRSLNLKIAHAIHSLISFVPPILSLGICHFISGRLLSDWHTTDGHVNGKRETTNSNNSRWEFVWNERYFQIVECATPNKMVEVGHICDE